MGNDGKDTRSTSRVGITATEDYQLSWPHQLHHDYDQGSTFRRISLRRCNFGRQSSGRLLEVQDRSFVDDLAAQVRRVGHRNDGGKGTDDYTRSHPTRYKTVRLLQLCPPRIRRKGAGYENHDHGDAGGVVVRLDSTGPNEPRIVERVVSF